MSSEEPKPRHWPFDKSGGTSDSAAAFRAALERKQARETVRATQREHMRHDRLIVGGRAHTKKHGLS